LNKYCSGEKYLKVTVEGAPRIDINGDPIGTVTAIEAAFAKERLKNIEEGRRKKETEKAKADLERKEIEKAKASLMKNKNKNTIQHSKPIDTIKPIPLEELRKRSLAKQVNEKPTPSKEQIKKEKQDKYAKKMARKKLK
jgi:sRNA-binding protein